MQFSLRDMLALTADNNMQMSIKFSPAESYDKKHTSCGCAAPATSASMPTRSTEQMLSSLTPAKRKSLDSLLALLVGEDD